MINIFKNAAPVTTSDTTDIPTPSAQDGLGNRGCFLYIGASIANIKVRTSGGQDVTILAPAVGRVLPIEVVRVFTTGSAAITANQIIALWR
jgi:hypothetical protein